MLTMNVLSVSIFSKTSLLLTYCVYGILSILLYNHISVVLSLFFIGEEIFPHSPIYKRADIA